MNKPIELPIMFHTDSTRKLRDMGMDIEDDKYEIKPMTFYQINCLSDYVLEDTIGCVIHSNGDDFITRLTRKEVEQLISKNE